MDIDVTSAAPSAAAPVPAPAAPSAADTSAPAPSASQAAAERGDFPSFRDARRAERAGKPLPAPVPASTSPAQPGSAAASTDASTASPASETGAPKPAGHGGNAETRIQELVARNKQLERDLASAKAGTPAPASPQTSRAGSSPAAPGAAPTDLQPNPDDATKYPAGQYDPKYITDLGAWGARQETRRLQGEADARTRAEADTAATKERFQGFSTRVEAAKAADPDFLTKLTPEVLSLKPLSSLTTAERGELAMKGDVATLAASAVMEEVIGSESSAALLLHFSAHPEDLARLVSLHPRQMLREFGKLEARLAPSAADPAAGAAPLVPVTSAAPPPPAHLGGRQTTPADPVNAAVVKQDFNAFRNARMAQRAAGGR